MLRKTLIKEWIYVYAAINLGSAHSRLLWTNEEVTSIIYIFLYDIIISI